MEAKILIFLRKGITGHQKNMKNMKNKKNSSENIKKNEKVMKNNSGTKPERLTI